MASERAVKPRVDDRPGGRERGRRRRGARSLGRGRDDVARPPALHAAPRVRRRARHRRLIAALESAGLASVLYEDVNDPTGVALLTLSRRRRRSSPSTAAFLQSSLFAELTPKPNSRCSAAPTRSATSRISRRRSSTGPRRRVLDPALPWAIWYPLRRAGSFEQLSARAGHHPHGARRDRDGVRPRRPRLRHPARVPWPRSRRQRLRDRPARAELHPLSIIVQRMRKTKQTSLHLERLGPFFVGRVAYQGAAMP